MKGCAVEPYGDLIRRMASEKKSTQQIADALPISVTKNQVSHWMRKHHVTNGRKFGGQVGSLHGRWKGGRVLEKGKYALIYCPDHPRANRLGYVREHRLVMEQKLGRYLEPQEVVHHLDGNTLNNHPENLELFENNAAHLAETLKGRVPNWTEEGRRHILEGCRKPKPWIVERNRARSKKHGQQLPLFLDQISS